MAQLFPNVLPGDLITADQMNRVFQELISLGVRVTALEGSTISGSAVVITDLNPPSGTVQVGTELRVIGRNFGFSLGATRVYIDDTRVLNFKLGSNDQQLIFDVPSSINVPQAGRNALLTVNNQNSTAQRTLSLLPSQILAGAADVIFTGMTPAIPAPNNPLVFNFRLRSRANLGASFAIQPVIAVAANQADWQSRVQVLDQSQGVIASNQISVPAGQEVLFSVRISQVPQVPNGTQFSLSVMASAGGVAGSSGLLTNTVGQAGETPDNSITLNFSSSEVLLGSATITSSQIQMAQGARANVALAATFTIVGQYSITTSLSQGAANWQVTLNDPPLINNLLPIVSGDLQGGIASRILTFFVVPQAGATSGVITFRIQRQAQGVTSSRSFPMNLVAV